MSDKDIDLQQLDAGLEKGSFSTFRNTKVIFRRGMIPTKLINFHDLELPNNSVLHSFDQFNVHNLNGPIVTDLTTPLIQHEKYQVYIKDIINFHDTQNTAFPITDKYRLNVAKFNRELQNFYTHHRGKLFRMTNEVATLTRATILSVYNYNALTHAILTGTFIDYRRFEVILKEMLHQVTKIDEYGDKFQFIHIPLSETIYKRAQFTVPLQKISYQTIRIKNDWSYYFLIHLLGYLNEESEVSLFNKLTPGQLDVTFVVLTVGDKTIVYNLGELKHMVDNQNFYAVVLKHITALKLHNKISYDISELNEKDYDKLIEEHAITEEDPEPTDHESEKEDIVQADSHPDQDRHQQVDVAAAIGGTHTTEDTAAEVKPTKVETRSHDLNRNDIILLMQSTFSATEKKTFFVGAGAAMVLHGLRKTTADIDVFFETDTGFEALVKKHNLLRTATLSGIGLKADLDDFFEVLSSTKEVASQIQQCMTNNTPPFVKLGDVKIASLELLELWYMYILKTLNRQKDKDNLLIVQQALAKKRKDQPAKVEETGIVIKKPVLVQRIEDHVENVLAQNTQLTPAQKERVRKLARQYLTVKIGDRTIHEILNSHEPKIDENKLHHLEDSLPDKSMTKSSIIDFDEMYITRMHQKDLASVVTSFAMNGLYLVSHEEHEEVSQLNRMMHHKFIYEDINGKRHTVRFRLPIVGNDGTFISTGVKNRMIKQQVNLPICKIDTYRVSLASNFNKTIVERIITKAHSFSSIITRYIDEIYRKKDETGLTVTYGKYDQSAIKLPYDYTAVAHRFATLSFDDVKLTFDYQHRFLNCENVVQLQKIEVELSEVFIGRDSEFYLFMTNSNRIRYISIGEDGQYSWPRMFSPTIVDLLVEKFGSIVEPPRQISEWTELKILDKNLPLAFILGFQKGLMNTLKHLALKYQFIPKGERYPRRVTTISVPFADGNLVFDRYPIENSFIASGLLKFNTKKYKLEEFDHPDIYYSLLQDSGMSMNYLKGIRSFFELFIDPITFDILQKMGEPTTVGELLLRANQMLTTEDAIPASSMANHRMRGYERFNAVIYNEMARQLSTYMNQRHTRKAFSINPDAVYLRIIQDQTVQQVEDINPIQDLKSKTTATYSGMGGRTAQSFVVEDRKYPDDGLGVLSECTPDSGKVAINTYTSMDPVISNIRGMFNVGSVTPQTIEPTQMLSATSLFMPCSTNDDAKRINFLNVQFTHALPMENAETMRIRTGFEKVIAQRSGDMFAYAAQRDGVVEAISDELQLVRIRYSLKNHLQLDTSTMTVSKEEALELLKKREPIYVIRKNPKDIDFDTNIIVLDDYLLHITEMSDYKNIKNFSSHDDLTEKDIAKLKQHNDYVIIRLDIASDSEDIDVIQFGTRYGSISGSYIRHDIVLNVQAGDQVKKGDIIAYNRGFFEPEYGTTQVTMKHGVMANVVFMEGDHTLEDSNAISKEFADKMKMHPAHNRVIQLSNKTVVHDIVSVGDHVETTDMLCMIEDADLEALTLMDDPEMVEILSELNRKAPKAKYHGLIAEIDILHSCPVESMHPTLAKLVTAINTRKTRFAKAASKTQRHTHYPYPSLVPVGTKYAGVEFKEDTVAVIFIIEETLEQGTGDKLVVSNQLKTITAHVYEQSPISESGVPIDMVFGGSSISNRIVTSCLTTGCANRLLDKLEQDIIDLYFD